MADLNDAARSWLTGRTRAVLITTRADGSPQSSNVLTAFDGTAFRVLVTADRAKTRNLARDPRAVVHVVGDDFWSYASVSCSATLGAVTTVPATLGSGFAVPVEVHAAASTRARATAVR